MKMNKNKEIKKKIPTRRLLDSGFFFDTVKLGKKFNQ